MGNQEQISQQLLKLLDRHFNEDELKMLTFKLDIEYEDLGGNGRLANIRELILYCERRQQTPDLIALLREQRPNVHWPGESGRSRLPMLFDSWEELPAPEKLIGRGEIMETVIRLLEKEGRALLTGFGGSGKTAVAQTIARQWIRDGRGRVIWMEAGQDDYETILDRLIGQFATGTERQEIGQLTGRARLRRGLQQLMARFDSILLVLDDVRNGRSIAAILEALPKDIPLLVTSRERFRGFHAREVTIGPLPLEDALELLSHYAGGQNYRKDEKARALVESFGYHAFALEIAGAMLEVDDILSPGELLEEIERSPHDVEMPDLDKDDGPAGIRQLLDRSFFSLDEKTQQVLLVFGALFSPGATSSLISVYMENDKRAISKELRELARRSLLKRRGPHFYEIHRLTFSYVKEKSREKRSEDGYTVTAVHRYVDEQAGNNELLAMDLDNILAAAQAARTTKVEAMVNIIYVLSRGGYFDANGYTPESLALLDETIDVVQGDGEGWDIVLHYLYSKRGNEYIERGNVENGVAYYQKALELAPDDFRKVVGLSVIGRVLAENGSLTEADSYFKKAHDIAASNENDRAVGFILQQQSDAAGKNGEYEDALEYATKAVQLNAPYKDENPDIYGYSLLNEASADLAAAQTRALSTHKRVLEIAEDAGYLTLMAHAHLALGLDYHGLHEDQEEVRNHLRDEAGKHLQEARRLFKKQGATIDEVEVDSIMRQYGYDASS